jgi:hypothetical protein
MIWGTLSMVDNDKAGSAVKRRNILLWYLLTLVTLGIAGIIWYYRINADAKELAQHKGWSPGLSVLATTLGAFLVVPAFVSYWRTWSRVRQATNLDGLSAGLQFCLVFIPIVNIAYMGYLQSKLNQSIAGRLPHTAGIPAGA